MKLLPSDLEIKTPAIIWFYSDISFPIIVPVAGKRNGWISGRIGVIIPNLLTTEAWLMTDSPRY